MLCGVKRWDCDEQMRRARTKKERRPRIVQITEKNKLFYAVAGLLNMICTSWSCYSLTLNTFTQSTIGCVNLQCVSCGPMGRHENGEMWMRNELREGFLSDRRVECARLVHTVWEKMLLLWRRNGKQRLFMFNNKIYFTTLMREWNVGEITFFLVFFFIFFFFCCSLSGLLYWFERFRFNRNSISIYEVDNEISY